MGDQRPQAAHCTCAATQMPAMTRMTRDGRGIHAYRRIRLSAPGFRHGGASRVAPEGHDRTRRCQFVACQAEELGMEQQGNSACKTFKYKLMPTPEQEQAWATILWRCREL